MNRILIFFLLLLFVIPGIAVHPVTAKETVIFPIQDASIRDGTIEVSILADEYPSPFTRSSYIGLYLVSGLEPAGTDPAIDLLTWTLLPDTMGHDSKSFHITAAVPSSLPAGNYTCFLSGVTESASDILTKSRLSQLYPVSIPKGVSPGGISSVSTIMSEQGGTGNTDPLPDYQVDGLVLAGNQVWITPGDTIRPRITVSNKGGNSCSGSPIPVLVMLGSRVLIPVRATIQPPGSGETGVHELAYTVPDITSPGSYPLSVILDPYRIREDAEQSNNNHHGNGLYTVKSSSKPHKKAFCNC